jgi:hypothetical protein
LRVENPFLNTALEKLRGAGQGEMGVPALDSDETKALTEYLNLLSGKAEKSEPEQLLCRHIREVLQQKAIRDRGTAAEEPAYVRTNFALRTAIDRFLRQEYARITAADESLLREVQDRLRRMAEEAAPSPNEIRLAELVGRCLGEFDAWKRTSTAAL